MLTTLLLPLLGKMLNTLISVFFKEVLTTPAVEKETINVETIIEPDVSLDHLQWL